MEEDKNRFEVLADEDGISFDANTVHRWCTCASYTMTFSTGLQSVSAKWASLPLDVVVDLCESAYCLSFNDVSRGIVTVPTHPVK